MSWAQNRRCPLLIPFRIVRLEKWKLDFPNARRLYDPRIRNCPWKPFSKISRPAGSSLFLMHAYVIASVSFDESIYADTIIERNMPETYPYTHFCHLA